MKTIFTVLFSFGVIFGFTQEYFPEGILKKYDHIFEFSDGAAMVKKDNKYGFIDTRGKEIIPFIY